MSKYTLTAVALAAAALTAAAHAETAITENTTVGGKGFIDFTNLDAQSAAGVKSAASGYGLDVSRFYLIAAHTFDENWSANLTTDFNYSSSTAETQLFIKKAYLQYKTSDAFWVRAGSADLTWVPFVEDVYGYRYFEKVLVDRTGFGTSADWGLHIGGKSGMFGYAVSAINGNGFKNPTRSKSVDIEARVSVVPVKGLTLALGTYSGKLGKDIQGSTTPPQHTASRVNFLINYAYENFRVGGEYFTSDNWKRVTSATTDKTDGYSVWAAFSVSPKAALFARVDSEKPSKDLDAGFKRDYYNAGVSFKPRKGVDLALGFKHEDLKGSATAANNGKSDEVGAWAQVAF